MKKDKALDDSLKIDNGPVDVFCYGSMNHFNTRLEAIMKYSEACRECDGHEKTRYANVLSELLINKKLAVDDYDELCSEYKNYHICKYCGNLVNSPDENVLCDECRKTFGHTYYSEL